MSVRPYREGDDDPFSQRLGGALLISILAHTTFFGVVQLGNQLHWWDARPFSMFRKVRMTPEEMARLREQQQRLEEARMAEDKPLIFVQVTQPSQEAPPDTPYYSSDSSRAANPDPGTADQPKIDGRQVQVIRTEDAPRIPLGSPSPPPEPPPVASQDARPPTPSPPVPVPDAVVAPESPTLLETVSEPVRAPGIGDLAMVRPEVRPVAPREVSPPAVTNPTPPSPQVAPVQAPRPRPRTVTEAKLRQELLAGEKMQQDGGVPRKGPVQLEVQGKSYGAYDLALVDAVQSRWFALLDEKRFAGGASGRVVINFKLYSDGSVRIVEPVESTVNALYETLCVRAVRDPAPFEAWPTAMLREVGRNFREIRFTFFYN